MKMSRVPEDILGDIVKAIVDLIDPEKIVLFGSQVTGNPKLDSDIDLLIIDNNGLKSGEKVSILGKLWRDLARFKYPLDLLLYTVEEVEKWRNSQYHIIGNALRDGKVIYERP